MQVQVSAMVLPEGSIPKVILTGDELFVAIVGILEDGVIVAYPDGYKRHHQARTVIDLLHKVEGQLRSRYNLTAFEFQEIPADLIQGQTIKIGAISYA